MVWQLAEPAEGLKLLADTEGVWFRSEDKAIHGPGDLNLFVSKTRLGRLLPTAIPQLLELGLAIFKNGSICIPHSLFSVLEDQYGIDLFEGVVPWSPFTIEIEAKGALGRTDFAYFYRFYLGTQLVHLERIGTFVKRGQKIYRLDVQTYSLMEAMDTFNKLPSEKKQSSNCLICFNQIKSLAEGVGGELDKYLLREKVIVPSKIGLDLIVDKEGRITFAPKIDGVLQDSMRQAFLESGNADMVYSIAHQDGGRVRVVLDEEQREILRRMQRVRHLGGADQIEVLRNPHAVFDGVAEKIDIDLSLFGPRVTGIGDFPFVVQPYLQKNSTGIFEGPAEPSDLFERGKLSAGLRCTYVDGTVERVEFTSRGEILQFEKDAKEAWKSGKGTINFREKSVLLDHQFISVLNELVNRVTHTSTEKKNTSNSSQRYLLIYTNEADVEYVEDNRKEDGETNLELPEALRAGDLLKDHQRAGTAWLQRSFKIGRRGCLLADDMGLGKTLQVLTFLAWLIEKGGIISDDGQSESAPWNPVLIVVPFILLENETWLNDMRGFFKNEGVIFKPWLELHGSKLQEMRRPGVSGRETQIGEAVLDLDRLCQYRVILTNYETIVNYQHSFARMKNWSVVVTDEAQEYKTSNTKVSHALKALVPHFRIACTGTPVETRLLDVWNLFDFLQPGSLLGSASEFTKRYEVPFEGHSDGNKTEVLDRLRERLQMGRSHALVLRRDKKTLTDLPPKYEQLDYCELSPEQRNWHLDLVSRAKEGGEGNHPLALLQEMFKLYQHPALIPRLELVNPDDAIQNCPKLGKVLERLGNIRDRGEKVLIFTRSIDMQQLLKIVIDFKFGLEVGIVNGATGRYTQTRAGKYARREIIGNFRKTSGFDVLILSPDVAGMGLTLTEANHVIHYGRWWNPAKESQATDRVYRIGQTRDVYVYFPIAKDPKGSFRTYDERLDDLLRRRRKMAEDFLRPIPNEDDLSQDLVNDLLKGDNQEQCRMVPLSKEDVRRLPWDRFEALVALLEEKQGAKVLLTPRTCDEGVDVIAVKGHELKLIQCKHTLWNSLCDQDVIDETICALDGFRVRRLRSAGKRVIFRTCVATNGTFTRRAKADAKVKDVQINDGSDLLQLLESLPCTNGEVERMEAKRFHSMRDIQAEIERLK